MLEEQHGNGHDEISSREIRVTSGGSVEIVHDDKEKRLLVETVEEDDPPIHDDENRNAVHACP